MIVDILRHGEVPGNREKRYVGITEESLTDEGRRQAKMRNRELQPADIVYVSPRLRCRQTAEILWPEAEQIVEENLAECDFGIFEYRNYQELTGNPDYQAWIDSGGTIGFPGGEDQKTFIQRSVRGFLTCMTNAEQRHREHIAIVAHGGTLMAVMSRLADPPEEYFYWQCGNLQGYRAEWDGEKLRNPYKI